MDEPGLASNHTRHLPVARRCFVLDLRLSRTLDMHEGGEGGDGGSSMIDPQKSQTLVW